MADHSLNSGPVEVGAAMDYPEHEKTYSMFIGMAKYGTVALVALMAAMAFGFFVGGFFSGLILFVLIFVAGWLAL